ncbi:GNAT family N-acetyltransferase [uncultured Sphingomonas sp.]|uniref:GNAT family N-acetyltransferase n=1 Tax=uncultured Sphingomonas sp. TaxID=158754 RepID=UPI0025E2BCB5|nr:GNAT family N-acetyltransferase [uncultured Sphingomonas sp.]
MTADRFRTATPSDIPALHALIESAYRGDSARAGWTHEADLLGGQRTDADALADMIADPQQRILIAGEDTPTGCVAITAKPPATAYLGMLTVKPDLQGAGLGRKLIAAAEEAARAIFAAETMEMTVIRQRPELIAWYERCGYVQTGERRPFPHGDARFGVPTDPALEFVVLEKPLR